MEKQRQIQTLWGQCQSLDADIRFGPQRESFTVLIPPPWNEDTETAAKAIQARIQT